MNNFENSLEENYNMQLRRVRIPSTFPFKIPSYNDIICVYIDILNYNWVQENLIKTTELSLETLLWT
jgi:hypothetical protein